MEHRSDRVASRAVQPDAVGLAPVEAEGELVEVGLQVLWLDRYGRANADVISSGGLLGLPVDNEGEWAGAMRTIEKMTMLLRRSAVLATVPAMIAGWSGHATAQTVEPCIGASWEMTGPLASHGCHIAHRRRDCAR